MTPLSPVAANTFAGLSTASAQMYLSSGSKNVLRRAVGGDLVDPAVGRRRRRTGRRPAPARARAPRARSHRRTSRACRPSRSSGPGLRCRCRPTACRPARRSRVHRNGAAFRRRCDGDGPRNMRPSLSIDRSSTSPFRKSACVDTVQNVGAAAKAGAATITSDDRGSRQRRARSASETRQPGAAMTSAHGSHEHGLGASAERNGHERLAAAGRAVDVDREHAGAASPPNPSAAPIRRRAALRIGVKLPPLRSPSSTASTDGGSDGSASPLTTAPGRAGEQADVDAVVAARFVEHANHLRHALRLERAAQLALLELHSAAGRRSPSPTAVPTRWPECRSESSRSFLSPR